MKRKKFQVGKKAYASIPVQIKNIDKENFTLTMVASTQDVDRHGDTIIQSGWDLKQFLKNPVILNSHNYYDVTEVIAKATRTEVVGKGKRSKLEQDWKFAVNENPKAKIIFDLYAGEFVNASSVGFIPTKFKENPDGSRDWFTIEQAELLEVSAVSVPANARALAKQKGIDIDKLDLKDYDNQDDTPGEDPESENDSDPDEISEDNEVQETDGKIPAENGDSGESGQEDGDDEPEQGDEADESGEADAGEDEAENDSEPEEDGGDTPEEIEADEQEQEEEDDEPEPEPEPKRATYKQKVVQAINKIEKQKHKRLKAAHRIINQLVEGDPQAKKLSKETAEKIRKRKVNKAIRNLMQSK